MLYHNIKKWEEQLLKGDITPLMDVTFFWLLAFVISRYLIYLVNKATINPWFIFF